MPSYSMITNVRISMLSRAGAFGSWLGSWNAPCGAQRDHFGLCREGLGAVGSLGPGLQMRRCRVLADVVHDELVAGLLKIGRHTGAHGAQSDESHLHGGFLRVIVLILVLLGCDPTLGLCRDILA